MYECLKKWKVKVCFSDCYGVYCDFIPQEYLIQIKSETHLIESNNFSQRIGSQDLDGKLAVSPDPSN